MTRESELGDLGGIFADEYCVAILTATTKRPVSVSDVVGEYEMAPATAYRKLDQLLEHGLIHRQTELDEEGAQHGVYEADFQSIKLEIADGIAFVHIVREEGHEVKRLWEWE